MTELQIYTLDSNKTLVASLAEGEYVFGRGALLQCDDKRVSRNHGVIKVEPSNITITSVHQNPCFHQAADSSTIIILPKHSPVNIQNCDKFALLADSFWYQIKIKYSDNSTSLQSKEDDDPNDSVHFLQLTEQSKLKDLNDDDSNTSIEFLQMNEKRKIEEEEEFDAGPFKKMRQEVNGNNSRLITTSDSQNTEILIPDADNRDSDESNNSIDLLNSHETVSAAACNEVRTVETNEVATHKEVISESEDDADTNKNIITHKEIISESEDDLNDIKQPDKNKKEVIVKKATPKIKSKKNQQNSDHQNQLRDMLFSSDEEEESDQVATTSNNVTGVPTNVKVDDDAEDKNNVTDQSSNTAGTSGTNNNTQRRDRCWYGGGCYRKSSQHLKEYTHPGDSDYDSDPNDARPLCIYGDACYRQNKDHRREYRHSKNNQTALNKKPTKNKAATKNKPKAPKKRTAAKTYYESSEDDYDLEDPFIGDSGSEFEADSVSDDSTDSDFSDGAEEETKRLLKEAKRFGKQKKG